MSRSRRNQVLTDETVQGELLFRAIVYWFFCLMVVSLLDLGWSMYSGPPRPLIVLIQESMASTAPAILGAVILLPLVPFDVLRVSNRFVGPVQQVRNTMRNLATGEKARPVNLRKDDFWQDLAQYTNELVARQEQVIEEENFPCTDQTDAEEALVV